MQNLLSNSEFAKEVYLNYLQCPEESWDPIDRCTGKFANNSKYSIPTLGNWNEEKGARDTIGWKCTIGSCSSYGWIEMENSLPDSLAKYSESTKTGLVKTMCQFIPDVSKLEDAKNYLENFDYDSTLIEQHYLFFGYYDGRPYKNCEPGHKGEEKTQAHAERRTSKAGGTYYDYSKYYFCWETDQIYVIK